jgi:hypothetical protein
MHRKTILVRNSLVVLGLVFVICRISFAQSPQRERITGPIAGSPAVWLEGNRRPMFQPENDQGPVADSLKLENISLMFKLTASQQADLTALLEAQQDPSSPIYHQWLTTEQYAARFGLSPNDINNVVAWLQAQGFEVTQTARSRTWVSFSGTAAQVQAAFLTEIHNFSFNGQTYYANASEPAVPAALADVVLGFHGLDNYPLKPRAVLRRVQTEAKPDFTSGISGNTFVAPGDFAIIYDVNSLYNNGIDGTNQSIAIMGQTDLYDSGSDITAFRSAAGLPANSPQVILIPGATDPGVVTGDITEASLDVEWSGAVAKNATIVFVNGGNEGVFNAFQYAIDNKTAPVISISYGDCEANWGNSNLDALGQLGAQANSQGQTIVAAAGDSGAADCDSSETSTITIATHGLAVDAPASLPYVTGMGGSEFNEGSGNYWQAATSAGGDILSSALSYIPEMVWNDTANPENTGNGLSAGGGGVSTYFTTKPAWQTGTGVPNDNARDVPDLSLNSSPLHDPLLVCVQGSCMNGFREVSTNPELNDTLTVVGGTSAAAPTFAGIVALINQQMNTPKGQGNINLTLYPMAANSPAAFHDITVGNNMVPCQANSPDCPASGEMGYSAGVGYDQASGLGSVDAFNLVTAWGPPSVVNLPAPTLLAPTNGLTGVALSPAFSWSAVTGNNGYRIMIATIPTNVLPTNPATTSCSTCTMVETSTTNSYTPSSALAAGTYYWQVQAIPSSGSGTGAWSNIFSFTTTGGTLPAPTLSSPVAGATAVSLPPTFTWTAVQNSAGYRILISPLQALLPTNPAVGTCGGCSAGTTTTAASYTPSTSDLAAGTTYYWEVQALAPSGSGQSGAWSSVSNFATAASSFSLSAAPSSLTVAPGASGTATLTLTPINNFSATPTFSCGASSSLAGVTCSVGTLSSSNTATITITASSSAASYPALRGGPRSGGRWVVGFALFCLLLLALYQWRRSPTPIHGWNLRHVALGGVLAVLLVASFSCGGSSSTGGGGGTTSPPAESGTVTVTGISGNTTQTTQISVSVS